MVTEKDPSLMGLAFDIGFRRLPLIVEGVEVLSSPASEETRV